VTQSRALIGDGALRLSMAGIERPRLDARLLLAHATGIAPDMLVGLEDVSDTARARYEGFLARRMLHEPVAYIVGRKEFWSLEFDVGPGVLIPRPETETLIEQAIEHFPDRSLPLEVIDYGTGSGCLLIALLSEFPNARGVGLDSSAEALAWAKRNLLKHGLDSRAQLKEGAWDKNFLPAADVILSNPPYIAGSCIPALPPDVRAFEPVMALDGGLDGLDAYRALAPAIRNWLKPNGMAFLEIGAGQANAVEEILAAQGVGIMKVAADLAGIDRCVIAAQSAQLRG
jgi:release factor glutamine methyltransferase